MAICSSISCGSVAQPEHTPCCSAHGHDLCCRHYCRRHFVEARPCTPETHSAATAVTHEKDS